MSSELAQFHEGFFAESLEALETMESALLRMAPGDADRDTIHTIFRAAHSIKSAAGMFSFDEIVAFTHALETLLDELRAGRLQVTAPIHEGLLESVDQLRKMLLATQQQQPLDVAASRLLQDRFRAMAGAGRLPVWQIRFKPLPGLLRGGMDPLQLFADLAGMGTLSVHADCTRIPPLPDLDPAHCHIDWTLMLATAVPRDSIELILEEVEGNCEISIEKDASPRPPVQQVQAQRAVQPTTPVTPMDSTIRVPILKLDEVLLVAGEAASTRSMLSALVAGLEGPQAERLQAGLGELESRLRQLQDSVMRVRMLPVSTVFSRLPRLVHDLSARLGKRVHLFISGEDTELDKAVLEGIGDPLVHLVRNCIDHGIELPEVRLGAGKPVEGTIRVQAFRAEGLVHIVVSDDGRGLDGSRLLQKARSGGLIGECAELDEEQVHQLVFLPGLSTADQATEVSGRGVGMDVVRRNTERLGGRVAAHSEPGRGTTIRLTLPAAQANAPATCARSCA